MVPVAWDALFVGAAPLLGKEAAAVAASLVKFSLEAKLSRDVFGTGVGVGVGVGVGAGAGVEFVPPPPPQADNRQRTAVAVATRTLFTDIPPLLVLRMDCS